jgi:hypothetical protein
MRAIRSCYRIRCCVNSSRRACDETFLCENMRLNETNVPMNEIDPSNETFGDTLANDALLVNPTILDRRGLERSACECYGVIKLEFDRLLGAHAMRNGRAPPHQG